MTFENYLIDRHAEQYQGLDDEMPDNYWEWLEELSYEEWIEYAEWWHKKECIRMLEGLRIGKVVGTETRIDLFKIYESKITEEIGKLNRKITKG